MLRAQPVSSTVFSQGNDAATANGTYASSANFSSIHYIEDSLSRASAADPQPTHRNQTDHRRGYSSSRRQSPPLYGHSGTAPTPGMYVRALYDYEADDRTSLTFHQGDYIQVLTQLESGWWDGVLNGVRGWFPSNYCEVVSGTNGHGDEPSRAATNGGNAAGEADAGEDEDDDDEDEDDSEDQYEDDDVDSDGNPMDGSPPLLLEGTDAREQEEAAYWIPQATPDGRLFYFNTMTYVSTMELPLETPTSATESGPANRTINVPAKTRVPAQMMAQGLQRDEDETSFDGTNSVTELDDPTTVRGSRLAYEETPADTHSQRQRQDSRASNGISPAQSMDSSGFSPANGVRTEDHLFPYPAFAMNAMQLAANFPRAAAAAAGSSDARTPGSSMLHSFFDDGTSIPATWNGLVENIRSAVELYQRAINDNDRSEYVRRAEDISDHLRLLLAAGSGTTDNHSGQPSIILTNKALYPYFRDMMSKFSKLVLSSHIAAADWPTPESYAKCLHEAEGVLQGVYGYVDVARQQRGEDVPRLLPGFVMGSRAGGNWQGNRLTEHGGGFTHADRDDYDSGMEPTTQPGPRVLERLESLKRTIVASLRRLEEHLVLKDKIVTPQRHEIIGDSVCSATIALVEALKPCMSTLESIDLSSLAPDTANSELTDFVTQRQRLYDLISDLIIGCQAVTGPLGDEWAELRGNPLEDRLRDISPILRELEMCIDRLYACLRSLGQLVAQRAPLHSEGSAQARINGAHYASYNKPWQDNPDQGVIEDDLSASSKSDVNDSIVHRRDTTDKLTRIFGVPPPTPFTPPLEESPDWLRLDYEQELAIDKKVDPPQLRGGTLVALVEQLTRHDKLDSDFNNTFLLTYRSFTSAPVLFDKLVWRFSIQPPPGLAPQHFQQWAEQKQMPIRLRVVNILKSWFHHYWMEGQDAASMDLLRKAHDFAQKSIATSSTPGAGPLMAVLEQRLRGQEPNVSKRTLNLSAPTPTPVLPKNMRKLKFMDIDVTEFARQLTIIESRLYAKIKPTECLNKTWQRKVTADEPEPAPNVKALILHSNRLTNWVAEMILTQTELKKRVAVLKHFIAIADVSVEARRPLR